MNAMCKLLRNTIGGLAALLFVCSVSVWAQNPSGAPPPPPTAAPDNGAAASPASPARGRHRANDEDGPRPVFGRIASIEKGSMKITRPDGSESVEEVDQPTDLIERSVQLMNNLRTEGWKVG